MSVALGGDDGIWSEIDGVTGDQFDYAIDAADGVGLDEAALVYNRSVHGDAAGVSNQSAGVVH